MIFTSVRSERKGNSILTHKGNLIMTWWRELCDSAIDVNYKSDILRMALKRSVTADDIADIARMMKTLPAFLQSYIAWDIICHPQTTIDVYKGVKRTPGLLAVTSAKNIQSAWERNHVSVSSI